MKHERPRAERKSPLAAAVAIAALVCSCGDPGDGSGTAPAPRSTAVATPSAARKTEIEDWVLRNHARQGHVVVRTDTLPNGAVVDWVDRASVAGADVPAPPPPRQAPHRPGKVAASHDVHGPPGTLPFARPAFSAYLDGTSPARSLDEYIKQMSRGNPNALSHRLYASARHIGLNYGVEGSVNNHWPNVTTPAGGDFVIAELATQNSTYGNFVGVTLGYIPFAYGAGYSFGVEFWDYACGCANWVGGGGQLPGWHQWSAAKWPGMFIDGDVSQVGDWNNQYAEYIAIEYGETDSHWWIFWNDEYVGYIDWVEAGFNPDAMNVAHWYAEATDPDDQTTSWMWTDMGSGYTPWGDSYDYNYSWVAQIWNPTFFTAPYYGGPVAVNAGNVTLNGGGGAGYDPTCYQGSLLTDGAGNPSLFFGGHGGGQFGCQ